MTLSKFTHWNTGKLLIYCSYYKNSRNNCERASYFFGLCEYSVNKKISIEEKMISVREQSH